MNIAIIAPATASFSLVSDITHPNKREYCERHGYVPRLDPYENERPVEEQKWGDIGYDRLQIMLNLLPEYDAVMLCDADCLFTNMTIPIEAILGNRKLVLSYDSLGFNCGSFIARSCPEVYQFLWAVLSRRGCDGWHPMVEQYGITQVLQQPEFDRLPYYMPGEFMNGYLQEEYGRPSNFIGTWMRGSWIMHLPGLSLERRAELATKHHAEAIR